ncbi:unnamed protein product, partial [marine sediment metagenome]
MPVLALPQLSLVPGFPQLPKLPAKLRKLPNHSTITFGSPLPGSVQLEQYPALPESHIVQLLVLLLPVVDIVQLRLEPCLADPVSQVNSFLI